ncbi:hypothetical protein BC835DRAFT_1266994, partial [Cytidiella melzeri]
QFNNHVSMVRIRSEHAIGFLKGRFQSLKGLRVLIRDEASHKFATYWIAACINLHAFAVQCEAEEHGDMVDEVGPNNDEFIVDGLDDQNESSESDEAGTQPVCRPAATSYRGTARIAGAKARRQQLKEALYQAKERRRERRRTQFDI